MFVKTSGLQALAVNEVVINATNRTGSTLTVGGVYAVDTTGSATESTTAETNIADVVAVATANLRGFLVVALGATLDDTVGRFLLKGVVTAMVDGNTDVAEGDRLIAQNASINLIKQGAGSLVVPCGIALEVQATNAGTLTQIYFDGETWMTIDAAS